jgi:filamentous hemagglutinin family protein
MKSIPFASLVGGLSILSGFCLSPTNAQIIRDRSLGEESSTVRIDSPSTNSIEGGAQRGANLFHSFEKFNVDEGLKVYFANPAGIENIFSRVTGNNFSQILGTLGVNGNANLFLINPNGIFFGANAQLDIRGSFVASTAESITFGDRFQFSAINPEAPPLLNIDLTPGLQYGTKRGSIDNKGILTVGENLALEAEKLNLEGQLYAGNH